MRAKPIFGSRPFGKRDAKLLFMAYFDPNGIETIPQGIEAWQVLSRHELVLLNLWPGRAGTMRLPRTLDLDDFDGIIIHPTVSYSPATVDELDAGLGRGLAEFDGVKILMKQDEQVLSGRLPEIVRDKGFDIVLTCVPPFEQERVYPRSVIGDCTLLQVLTGYVTPAMRNGMPKGHRDIQVSYRGSIQPLAFGRLGYEKRGVGYDVAAALSRHRDISVDISSRWDDRLTGTDWDQFLARSGTVLGVESGANIFDFDGEVAKWCGKYAARHADEDAASYANYREANDEYLHTVEGNVDYAQISPRHFEAAVAGAAQLLYEGRYSGIFKAHDHFFPLRRDLGNLEEAVDFIRDDHAQREMAGRVYEEIILDPQNWYEALVSAADDAIDAKLVLKGRARPRAKETPPRPLAYVLAAHDPAIDPRIGWFASSLNKTHDLVVIGTYRFDEIGAGPSLQEGPDGIKILRVERTAHDAAWIPSAGRLRHGKSSVARSLLAHLVGYAAAPNAVLELLLGSHVGVESELERFRALCGYMIDTNSALLGAIERLGAPDLVVAADLEALFAAVACGEDEGSQVVFDAHEYWPYSYTDFQHWEIEFWSSIEARLAAAASLRIAVTPQLAHKMGEQYDVSFLSIPNAATRSEGEVADLEAAFARRGENGPLRVLYQGRFAHGRGLEEIIRAWPLVASGAILILRGPDNGYRQTLIGLARSLGLDEGRVEFPQAVPEKDLIAAALQADIGLIPYNPAFFGYRYCCPNKLSQYAAAGLPILTSETEFVAETVREHGIGYVMDIADPRRIAELVDDLAQKKAELVAVGRRARGFFEGSFNWDALSAPILDKIGTSNGHRGALSPDFSWIDHGSLKTSRPARPVAMLSPSIFGGGAPGTSGAFDLADAEKGASIIGSSPFFARPHDADYLLRREVSGGYAAALNDSPLPHWIEIDLGASRPITRISLEWYDFRNFARSYRIAGRNAAADSWVDLVQSRDNEDVQVIHDLGMAVARYLRLEADEFEGQDRLLLRSFRVFSPA